MAQTFKTYIVFTRLCSRMHRSQVPPPPDHDAAWPTTVRPCKVTPDLPQLPSSLSAHPPLRDAIVQPFPNPNHHHPKYFFASLQLLFWDLFSRQEIRSSEPLFFRTCLNWATKMCCRGFRWDQDSHLLFRENIKRKIKGHRTPHPHEQSQGQEP